MSGTDDTEGPGLFASLQFWVGGALSIAVWSAFVWMVVH